MKLSYNLLKEFVKIKLPPEKLGQILTEHSFEVEKIVPQAYAFSGIVAAKVLEVQKHPNADRLRVVKADIGGTVVDPVVCGAFNFGAGDMVALALPGARIAQNIHSEAHEPFILKNAKIRGIESQGMICAAFELGLAEEPGEGIMLLEKSVKPGTPLSDIFNSTDTLLETALPANRPDLYSHFGIAQEIAAVLNIKMSVKENKKQSFKTAKGWKVEVKDKKLCPKYFGLKFSNVKITPSPKALQDVLKTVGLRPVNNVVDATNLVMLELGQPLHAFDAGKVSGNIVVRRAKKGEKFTALNHKEYNLDEDMLLISDKNKSLALAGIMGGLDSEITGNTTDIILEAANFNQFNIRQTSKRLGLKTDSGSKFEKGLHPHLVDLALLRAANLLTQLAGARPEGFAGVASPEPKPAKIRFVAADINKLLGTDFKTFEIKKFLSRFQINSTGTKSMLATPPWWRTDLLSPADLAEELIKLVGYNKLSPRPITIQPAGDGQASLSKDIYQTKNYWARLGYFEVQNYNFISEKDIRDFGETRPHLEIANPLSSDQRYLKRHLLIPLLKNVSLNQKNSNHFKLFEVGKQYLGFENEPLLLSSVSFSKTEPMEKLLMGAKGDILEYLQNLGIGEVGFGETGKPWLNIQAGGQTLGLVGVIEETVTKKFDIDIPIIFTKLELEKVLALKKDILYKPVSKFPGVQRDISIIVSKDVLWENVEKTVKPTSNLIRKISLFEAPFLAQDKTTKEYHKNLGIQGKQNLGIRLNLEAFDHTLTEAEVASILDKIVLKLRQEFKAEIR
jgi:phenylalanyl-tRNA synthetase beta chain